MSVVIEVLQHTDREFALRISSTKKLEAAALKSFVDWLDGSQHVRLCTMEPNDSAILVKGEFINGYEAQLDKSWHHSIMFQAAMLFSPTVVIRDATAG